MIKRAQLRFICIVMSILLGVFTIIFGVSYFILRDFNERAIERTLEDAKNNFLLMTDNSEQNNSIIAVIIKNSGDDYLIKEKYFDNKIFTEDLANSVINSALSRPHASGAVKSVYYKISQNGTEYLFVAADMKSNDTAFHSDILKVFIWLAIIYAILFFIVWQLSFSVLRPIKEAFFKQKQFISNASHELKTPLTIISANADVINENGDNPWANNIKSQSERLDALIADMLTLAKMDEDKMELTSVEFNLSEEIINNALAFDAVAYEKGKTLDIDIEPDINYKGDLPSVKKIVNILLDNAVKHAEIGGEILVKLKKENGKIILSVFNTGSHVPAEESNKVFERFYRGDASRSRESGGSGLGLSIAKSVADANKWKISAKSVLDVSMTITIIFS